MDGEKTDGLDFELEDVPAEEITGFNYTKAREYTAGLKARLEKTGLTDIEFAKDGVDPNRQRAVWFIPDEKSPTMTANYGDYYISVFSKSVTASHVLERRDGSVIDLRDEEALPAAGILSDGDLDRALADGSFYTMADDFLFEVVAWRAGDFDKVYDQWDAYWNGEAHSRPRTFYEALTMGVAMAVVQIDEIEGKVNEDLDGDSAELELDDVSDEDLMAVVFSGCVKKEYDAGGVKLYVIKQEDIFDAIANRLLGVGEDASLRDVRRWWEDNADNAIRWMLPADCKASWQSVARSAGKILLSIGKIEIVVGQSWTLTFNSRKMMNKFYVEPSSAYSSPDGNERNAPSCLAMALAILSFDSDGGIGEAVADVVFGRLGNGAKNEFLDDFRACRLAERVLRTRRYLVPNDCNAAWWLCSKDAYSGIYDETGIEKVVFSTAPARIDEFDTFWMLPIRDVELPNGVAAIGSGAFAHMDRLSKVYVPETVTSIGASAFYTLGGRDGGKPLTVCFEGSEADFGPFMRDYGDGVVAKYGVTREEYRRMRIDESLGTGEGELEIDAVPEEDVPRPWEADKDAHMAAIKGRLESCGYSDVEFFQDVFPSRDCAEWYCDSGQWNTVVSFSNADGLSFTISAGGDHIVLIGDEAYMDMDELERFGIYDDDGLGRVDSLNGFSSFEGWCEFEVEVHDVDGDGITAEEADGESIGCTLSEALDYVTDPGSVNHLIDEYRRKKAESRQHVESLREDDSTAEEPSDFELDDIDDDDLLLRVLGNVFAVEYDGTDGVVYTMDGETAERNFTNLIGSSMTSDDVEMVCSAFCSRLPKKLRWAEDEVARYLYGTVGNIHDRLVVAGGADWLVMFAIGDYSVMPKDVRIIPSTVEDRYGTEWRPETVKQALAANVGEADVGISRAVWLSRQKSDSVGRESREIANDFRDKVIGLASAMRISSSGEYVVPDDFNERTIDALDDSWCDAGNDIMVRFRDGLANLGGEPDDGVRINLGGYEDNDVFIGDILRDHVNEIELPDGLRTIGSGVMLYLQNVRRIFVPKTVTAIGANPFPRPARGTRLTIAFEGAQGDYPKELMDRVAGEYTGEISARVKLRFGVSRAEFRSLDEALGGDGENGGQADGGQPQTGMEGQDDSDGLELDAVGTDELMPTSVSDCVRKVYDGADGELWVVDFNAMSEASRQYLFGDVRYVHGQDDVWGDMNIQAKEFADNAIDILLPKELSWAVQNVLYTPRILIMKTADGRQARFNINSNSSFSCEYKDVDRSHYLYETAANAEIGIACTCQADGGLVKSLVRHITALAKPDRIGRDGSGYGEKQMLKRINGYAYVMRAFETGVLTYPECSSADLAFLHHWDSRDIDAVRTSLRLPALFDEGRRLRVEFSRKASTVPYITLCELFKQYIESIEFPDGVKMIGERDGGVFYEMPKLRRIFLPKGADVDAGALSSLRLCNSEPTLCLEDSASSALARKIVRVCGEERSVARFVRLRCGVTREQFRSMGGWQVAEGLTEDGGGLELDDVPAEDLLDALPQSDEAKELVAFLKDVSVDGMEFVTVGHRVYEVLRSGEADCLPFVYSFDGDGILMCRLTFPSRDAEAAAAELVLNGVEPDGIDGMIEAADEKYDSTRVDSVPECIDFICDMFEVRDYAGYDDWKEQTGHQEVV